MAAPSKEQPRLRLVGTGLSRRLVQAAEMPKGPLGRGEDQDGPCWPEPVPVRRDLFEIASAGFDPNLQLIGGDPSGTPSWGGLVVPSAPTPSSQYRYLFMLAWMRLDANRWGRIRGIRTNILLGASIPSTVAGVDYNIEHELQNPFWKAPNGNVCFMFQKIASPPPMPYNTRNGPSLSYRYSNSPALLFETLAPAYQPPGAGQPPGVAISQGLGTFYDNRFGVWRNEEAWGSVDIAVQGPCDIALFCSVFQMAGAGQPVPPPGTLGLPSDDAFLMNNPATQFKRVVGAFVWEENTAK